LLGLRVSNLGPCNAMAQLALFLPDALP
jgi:hypothetical protein